MNTLVKDFKEMVTDEGTLSKGWRLKAIINDDNLTYLAFNEEHKEALIVDPMREDWEVLISEARALRGYRWLSIIDTHTHADHISCAARLAEELGCPLLMSEKSPSRKIHLRVSRDFAMASAASPLKILVTPGHTPDSLTPVWGPFVFSGDTLLYGDIGRDDLPGGDPAAHFESVEKIKALITSDQILCPGHDSPGRVSTWKTQLKVNPSLSQGREQFVSEAGAYVGPSPKNLKESLFENFK